MKIRKLEENDIEQVLIIIRRNYKKYGFIERPNDNLGAGMVKPF